MGCGGLASNVFPFGKLVFMVTSNINKFNEARKVLREFGVSLAMLRIKAVEIQEDDIEKIAIRSALEASEQLHLPIIVEDAGLFINALNGFPGPYSNYVYRTIGVRGVLKLLEGQDDRRAFFKSVVAFCNGRGGVKCFQGVAEGRIVLQPRGDSGFGFDPIFEPDNSIGKTFGEMPIDEKNLFSHRAQALRKFAVWYKSEGGI
ncbi:MAG: XTP/dITP diphosphatase [Nitrososphaerota archaeon]|nr:XTP/dITP diphosphatase [Candidatus Bathyarchaeota archaeon]MDW8048794.1 XTP/dITP diphosphatase [Nitrososphaerota archaeon]